MSITQTLYTGLNFDGAQRIFQPWCWTPPVWLHACLKQ